jgi:hypothetical protein
MPSLLQPVHPSPGPCPDYLNDHPLLFPVPLPPVVSPALLPPLRNQRTPIISPTRSSVFVQLDRSIVIHIWRWLKNPSHHPIKDQYTTEKIMTLTTKTKIKKRMKTIKLNGRNLHPRVRCLDRLSNLLSLAKLSRPKLRIMMKIWLLLRWLLSRMITRDSWLLFGIGT